MSFDTAVSGLKASSTNLEIIGNNIANAGTTGFKTARGEFSDVFTTSLLGGGNNIGRGVAVSGVNQSFTQGNVSSTNNGLDMAINGGGFFVLSDNGTNVYSRAGNFQVDRSGSVVNAQGNKLQILNTTDQGVQTGGINDLVIDTSLIQPVPTSQINIVANLDSRAVEPGTAWAGPFDAFAAPATAPTSDMFNASTSITIYDSLGNPHVQSMIFRKDDATPNTWDVYTLIDGVSVSGPDSFSYTDTGAVSSLPAQVNVAAWTPLDANGNATGAAPQSFAIDLQEISQFGADFAVTDVDQDGFTTGQLSGIEVGETGVVFARYTNGQSRALGQVALSNFTNTSGLQPMGGSIWAETFASGEPIVGSPGIGGLGIIQSGALEESNVEVSQELVNMIVAQRNFQANAKVIQTEDTITQAVINLR